MKFSKNSDHRTIIFLAFQERLATFPIDIGLWTKDKSLSYSRQLYHYHALRLNGYGRKCVTRSQLRVTSTHIERLKNERSLCPRPSLKFQQRSRSCTTSSSMSLSCEQRLIITDALRHFMPRSLLVSRSVFFDIPPRVQ